MVKNNRVCLSRIDYNALNLCPLDIYLTCKVLVSFDISHSVYFSRKSHRRNVGCCESSPVRLVRWKTGRLNLVAEDEILLGS